MAQILIKGESVYACDVCNRKVRIATSRTGIDVVQRCTITYGCRGKLHRVTEPKEVNATPAFPLEIAGVQDWFQRRVVYNHTQPIKSAVWTIKHNLQNRPIVEAYVVKQTLSSPTYDLTENIPTGAVWYKSASGIDPAHPHHPTAAGLYSFDGTRWVRPKDIIPVGNMGNNVYEYLQFAEPMDVRTIDANTTELVFDSPHSGMAQCVSLASQNTTNPVREKPTADTTPIKLTNAGEITIATASADPFITIAINLKSESAIGGLSAVFQNVDNTTSVKSAWVNADKIFVNGRLYTVRSFDISGGAIPSIMASGNVDPQKALFTFENFGSTPYENLILLGTHPHSVVDRVYNKIVDIASLNKDSQHLYFNNNEVYVTPSAVQIVHPQIQTVDAHNTSADSVAPVVSTPTATHWINTIGGTSMDYGYAVATDSSGHAYVVGYTSATTVQPEHGEVVIKYSTTGDIVSQWYTPGTAGDVKRSVATDANDNVYIAGTVQQSSNNTDLLVTKYDTNGAVEWQKTIGGTATDYGHGIAVDGAGNVYVVGHTTSNTTAASSAIVLVKLNSSGAVRWQKTIDGSSTESGYGVTTDSSGDVYVTGHTFSQGSGGADLFISKFNPAGTVVWQRALGGVGNDYGFSIASDAADNLYVVGDTTTNGQTDIAIVKYSSTGNPVWQRTLVGPAAESGYSIACDKSNNVYVAGQTQSQGAGSNDIFVVKMTGAGSIVWQRTLGSTANTINDRGNGIALDKYNNIYVAGQTGSPISDIVLAKLDNSGAGVGVYDKFAYTEATLGVASVSFPQIQTSLTVSNARLAVNNALLPPAPTNLESNFIILP